jgi:hypothetical protein
MAAPHRKHQATVATDWILTAVLCGLCLIYALSFLGQAARLLPPPLDEWHDVYYRLLGPWWHYYFNSTLSSQDNLALYRTIEVFVLGLFVPMVAMRFTGRSLSDIGFDSPNSHGRRLGVLSLLIVLPVGFWLSAVTPNSWGSPLYEVFELCAMLPEHFLFFGVFVALMLPGRRLPRWPEDRFAYRNGGDSQTLGPARIGSAPSQNCLLGFLGLTSHKTFAVGIAGSLFGLAHVGEVLLPETLLAFPIGLLFAYVTLRTSSIWPALVAHWMLNIVPYIWQFLQFDGV